MFLDIIGFLLLFFVPGSLIVIAYFKELDFVAKLTFTMILSVLVAVIIGFFLGVVTPIYSITGGIIRGNIFAAYFFVVLFFSVIAFFKK